MLVRFRMLDNVVFFERPSGNAMHERGGVFLTVSDGSKTILVLRAQRTADAIYLTFCCLVVMEPLAKNIELLLPLRDCRQVYCHFEKVFQRTSENAAPPSRSPCRVPETIARSHPGNYQWLRVISAATKTTRREFRIGVGLRLGSNSSFQLTGVLAIARIAQAAANLVRSIDCTASQMILLIRTFSLRVSQLVRSAQKLIRKLRCDTG